MTYTTDTQRFHNHEINKICDCIDNVKEAIIQGNIYIAIGSTRVKDNVKGLLDDLEDRRNMLQTLCAEFELAEKRQLVANILANILCVSNYIGQLMVGVKRSLSPENECYAKILDNAICRVRALWYIVVGTNLGEVAEELINEELTNENIF